MNDRGERSPFGFEDLEVYKACGYLRNEIYKLVGSLPAEEKFALASQMRRAAVSITNNIAEGHGRYNWQDNTKFCRNARGSLFEVVDDINICLNCNYAPRQHLEDLKTHASNALKLLNGYIAYLQKQKLKTK